MRRRDLRSGYTTGACAEAAAKAATQLLTGAYGRAPLQVSISFPDGSNADFAIHTSGYRSDVKTAFTSVIKDAGDDPDVTNGAEIVAEARLVRRIGTDRVIIKGGKGVGTVTKPGIALPV